MCKAHDDVPFSRFCPDAPILLSADEPRVHGGSPEGGEWTAGGGGGGRSAKSKKQRPLSPEAIEYERRQTAIAEGARQRLAAKGLAASSAISDKDFSDRAFAAAQSAPKNGAFGDKAFISDAYDHYSAKPGNPPMSIDAFKKRLGEVNVDHLTLAREDHAVGPDLEKNDKIARSNARHGSTSWHYIMTSDRPRPPADLSLSPPRLTCMSDILLDKGEEISGMAADVNLGHDYGPVDYWREIDGHPVPFIGADGEGRMALPGKEQPGAYRIHTDKGNHTVAILRPRNGSGYEVRHTMPSGEVQRSFHFSKPAANRALSEKAAAIHNSAVATGTHRSTVAQEHDEAPALPQGSDHLLTRDEFRAKHPGTPPDEADRQHRAILNAAQHRGVMIPRLVMQSHAGHHAAIFAARPLPAITHGERESAPIKPLADPPLIGGYGPAPTREEQTAAANLPQPDSRQTHRSSGIRIPEYTDSLSKFANPPASNISDLLPDVDAANAQPNAVTHLAEPPKPAQPERFIDRDTGEATAHPPGQRTPPPLYALEGGSAIGRDRAHGIRARKMRDLDKLEEHYSDTPDGAKRQRVYETVHAVRQDLADRANTSDWQGPAEKEDMHQTLFRKFAQLYPERIKGKTSGSAAPAEGSAPGHGESQTDFYGRLNAGMRGRQRDEDIPVRGAAAEIPGADYGPKARIALPHVGDNTPWVARIKGVNPRFAVGSDPGLAREFVEPHHVDESGANETGSLGISSHYHLGEGVYESHTPTSFKAKGPGNRSYFRVRGGQREMMFPAEAHEYARGIGKVNLSRLADPPRFACIAGDIDLSNGTHKFASTQINLTPHVAARVKAMAAKIPDEHLAEDGREDEPHVTVKYGLHADGPDEARQALAGEGPARMTLGKTDGRFEIRDGNARTLAYRKAGKKIPAAILVDKDSKEVSEILSVNQSVASNLTAGMESSPLKPVDTSRQLGVFSQGQEIGERPGQVDLPGLSIPKREPPAKPSKVKAPKVDPDQMGFNFSRHHLAPPPRMTCMADDIELAEHEYGKADYWRDVDGHPVPFIGDGGGKGQVALPTPFEGKGKAGENRGMEPAKLIGSDKQIAWAEEIRKPVLDAAHKMALVLKKHPITEHPEAGRYFSDEGAKQISEKAQSIAADVHSESSARDWIDKRKKFARTPEEALEDLSRGFEEGLSGMPAVMADYHRSASTGALDDIGKIVREHVAAHG